MLKPVRMHLVTLSTVECNCISIQIVTLHFPINGCKGQTPLIAANEIAFIVLLETVQSNTF